MRLKSKGLLRDMMTLRQIPSAYALARAADLKPGIVGHLVTTSEKTGRWTCSVETAAAIERALKVDTGALFDPEMLQVVGNGQRRERAA